MKLKLFFDGASRGNPGPVGAGAWIEENGKSIVELKKYLGRRQTNNYAEYQSIILGVDHIIEMINNGEKIESLDIVGDSQLAIRQLQGRYKVRSENIIPLYKILVDKLAILKKNGVKLDYIHIKRGLNQIADKLANQAIDHR